MKMPSVVDYAHYHAQMEKAKELAPQATADVEQFARDLQDRYEIPIRVSERPGAGFKAISRSLWNQPGSPDGHAVFLGRLDPWERPCVLGHELIHIAMECEAHAAGARRTVMGSPGVLTQVAAGLPPNMKNFTRELFTLSSNVPMDMFVETRIHRDFPNLGPTQFVASNRAELEESRNGLRLDGPAFEEARFNYFGAVMGARALFKDRLFGTRHFSRFAGKPMEGLAERLYNAFAAIPPGPAAHYRLFETWDELGGFPGLHVMDPRPAWEIAASGPTPVPAGTGSASGIEFV